MQLPGDAEQLWGTFADGSSRTGRIVTGPEKGNVIPGQGNSFKYVWQRLSHLVLWNLGKRFG